MQRTGTTIAAVLMLFAGVACGGGGGETKDRPEDCTDDEFYNEPTDRCTPCPAVEPPECPDGCGYRVYEREDNGCEAAECAEDCEYCDTGEHFDEEAGLCRECPGRPECSRFSCQGSLQIEGSFRAPCPPPSAYACGECTEPGNGCVPAGDGTCTDVSN